MGTTRARTRRVAAAWVGAVTATVLNGILVGYGAVWLQLFGESADAEDFSVSAGGYGAAAESARAEPVSSPVNTAWDGIGGVLWAPWAWVLVALGVRGLYRMAGSARSGPPRGLSRR